MFVVTRLLRARTLAENFVPGLDWLRHHLAARFVPAHCARFDDFEDVIAKAYLPLSVGFAIDHMHVQRVVASFSTHSRPHQHKADWREKVLMKLARSSP